MTTTHSPTLLPNMERAKILDILRGFALLGIYIANSQFLSGYGFMPEETKNQLATSKIDNILRMLQFILVEGKFYSLFSLLFGIGFSIILVTNERRGSNGLTVFYRRLLILILFGLAHLLLLWEGDILMLYGLIGLLLPLFRKCTDRTLLTWAACLILAPILADIVWLSLGWTPGQPLLRRGIAVSEAYGITEQNFGSYLFNKESGYAEVLKWCQGGIYFRYQYILDSGRIMKVLGIFLVGYYVGRKKMYVRPEEHFGILKRVRKWGFIIGIPVSIAAFYFIIDDKNVPRNWAGLADTVCYALGVVPMSLAYTASITLFWIRHKESTMLNRLAPAGRMALTNYIFQTIFSVVIFYGVGFGLGHSFGYTYVLLIVVAVYLFQVLYSTLWLRYYNYGPLEWIWRMLTYGKALPLRKKNAAGIHS
jgi:uncharacterized protein